MQKAVLRPELWVEGKNDCFTFCHLLERHGIDIGATTRQFDVRDKGSVQAIFQGMELAIRQSRRQPIGFVLDADWTGNEDGGLAKRWAAVTRELGKVGVNPTSLPTTPPTQGLIIGVPSYLTTVGVWLMPDNKCDGGLEEFLAVAGTPQPNLLQHARDATAAAKSRYAAHFRDVDRGKAAIYAFLAWQSDPGRPPGEAMSKAIFDHDGPVSLAFVQWFRSLYGL